MDARPGEVDHTDLATRAAAAGTTVAVVIPARDEAATVGEVVRVLRTALVDDVALLDELVVVDDDSSDRTAEIAAEAGATVVHQSEVHPEVGPPAGKGDALWRGLAATESDLVVFVDADLTDPHPRLVTGIVDALLRDPGLVLVKAGYDRPLALGDVVHPTGGGRVTELLARPLLAAFWPELAARLSQPLAGEYGGRRSALEAVPFVCGYGVELGLLIDLAERHGADAIGEVDLGSRGHGHQPLDALGRMAAELLAVATDRLAASGRYAGALPSRVLPQPIRRADGSRGMVEHTVELAQRPPLTAMR